MNGDGRHRGATVLGVIAGAVALVGLAGNAGGLERRASVPVTDPDVSWDAASTCAVTYANICTGWQWRWTTDSPSVYGMVFDPCCDAARLEITRMEFGPAQYGFSGTVRVFTADADGCPQAPLAGQGMSGSGSLSLNWGVECDGPIVVTLEVSYAAYGIDMYTDHPSAGPTGPPALGLCYPSTRVTHSFYYGSRADPLCPGSPLLDGAGPAELRWTATFSCLSPVAPASWGAIKALYR